MPPKPLIINRILGRNGIDPPQDLPDDMAAEVLNMDFYDGSLGRKRNGASDVTLNGFSAGNNRIDALGRYLPSDDETAAELHVVDSGALTTIQRLAGGTTWATYALANAIQANSVDVVFANFNGGLVQAYNSAVNRLHWYPSAGGTHAEMGLAQPGTPTTATGAGAVTDVRQYAVCWTRQSGGVTVARSNRSALTASVTLSSQQTTVTRPTAASESETHWELYAYSDDDNFATGYLIATTAIATTTATDNNTTLSGAAPPESGANTPFPSVKYVLSDGSHLIGAGAWETSAGTGFSPSPRLVCWTPALGTSSTDGDAERMMDTTTQKTYLYVDAGVTGLGGPLFGNVYVFGYRNTWKLVPTGQAAAAYNRITLRTDIGCIRHQTICMGEDEQGRPALYWLSHIGPFRSGANGIQYIGRDVEDRWSGVNLGATSVMGWSLFHPARHQVWFFVAQGGSQNDPNEVLVFDCRLGRIIDIRNIATLRYGWSRFDGRLTEARHGVLFANTLGASMSRDLLPYVGRTGTGISSVTLWKLDTGTQDAGTNYQGYITTKTYTAQLGRYFSLQHDAYLLAETQSGVTITLTIDRDFGVATDTSTALLTAAGSETRTFEKFEGAAVSEAKHVSFQLGDASAANTSFVLDALVAPLMVDDLV